MQQQQIQEPSASRESALLPEGYSALRILADSSASTSFVSRCIVTLDFARFDDGALFFADLLCFFKVDLVIHRDCSLEVR
jgi:hypothetical protein